MVRHMEGASHTGRTVILVDGTCVFCNRLLSFILDHDADGEFYFAHLQSAFGREAKRRHGFDVDDVDGVYALLDAGLPTERLVVDGEAGRAIWPRLFRLAAVVRWVPLPLLDAAYRAFSRVRFKLFGRYDSCHVPTAAERARCVE